MNHFLSLQLLHPLRVGAGWEENVQELVELHQIGNGSGLSRQIS